MDKVIPVRVSVRIRPLVPRELREGSQVCLDVTPNNPQVSNIEGFTFRVLSRTKNTTNFEIKNWNIFLGQQLSLPKCWSTLCFTCSPSRQPWTLRLKNCISVSNIRDRT